MTNRLSRSPSAMEGIDLALARAQEERRKLQGAFDTDLYGAAGSRFEGYHTSIPASGDEDDLSAAGPILAPRLGLASYTGYDAPLPSDHDDHTTTTTKSRRIIDRENEYRRRRLRRSLSPDRHDAFAAGEATPDSSVRTYADAMRKNRLQHRKEELLREIAKIQEEQKQPVKRRDRWDVAGAENTSKKQRSRWDDDETPKKQRSRWDDDETPKKRRLRWDDETPLGAEHLATPTPSQISACVPTSPELYQHLPWERDMEERSQPLTDDELDAMFPQKGYKILKPPATYKPIRTPARRLLATTPTPLCTPSYALPAGGVQLRFLEQMQ
ncbi:unnamed protein product [Alopecurus aequalis]